MLVQIDCKGYRQTTRSLAGKELTLKAPRKRHIRKCRLLKSSAAKKLSNITDKLSIEANGVVPEQTAHIV